MKVKYLYLKVETGSWDYVTSFITEADFNKEAKNYEEYLISRGHSGLDVLTSKNGILTIDQCGEVNGLLIKVPVKLES